MDVFNKFLECFSYKFPKGYPDINDKQDVLLLESILSNMGIEISLWEAKLPFENLSLKAQEIAKEIAEKLDIPLENIKSASKNRILILTDEKRDPFFTQLEDMGFERDVNISGSSQGGVKNQDGIEIIIKPLSKQGALSAGKQNEDKFNILINSHIEDNGGPITVIFKNASKNLKYENVAKCEDASIKGATQYEKADSELYDSSGKLIVGISLKKRNAIRWESSKGRPVAGVDVFKSFIEKVQNKKFPNVSLQPLEQKNKYKLYNPKEDKILSKVIITNTPPEVVQQVVFGKESEKTIVIKDTFEGSFKNYSFENGVLTIDCYKIYTDTEDIIGTGDEPIFAFSNHIGQAYGIEFRSFSKEALYRGDELKGSSVEIKFDELK